jgi:hypothetical protein
VWDEEEDTRPKKQELIPTDEDETDNDVDDKLVRFALSPLFLFEEAVE